MVEGRDKRDCGSFWSRRSPSVIITRLIPLSQVIRFLRHQQVLRRLTTCLIRNSAQKYEEENVFRSMMPD